jgi:HAE1 family hydrophobic/amphiphilic exporter-1
MPQPDQGTITMTVELRSGTRLEETSRIARKVDEILHSSSFPEIEVISTSAGSQEEAGLSAVFQTSGSNIINYNLSLSDASERKRSSEDIAEEIRMKLRDIPKIKTYNVNVGRPQPGMSNKVNINIYGYNLDKTTQLAHQLSTKVKKIKGARNVNISREEARPELQIKLNRDKITKLGLNTAMISSSLRNRIDGLTATQFREFGEEYDVIVRYKEEARNSITDIENMIVYNPMGKTVHLGEIARVKEVWSPPNIERMSRERVVTVSAKPYQTSMGGLAQSMQQVLNETDIPEEMNVEVGGAYEDQMEGFKALGLLLVISLILVYIVMASQFESMKMPLIIMFSIPFAFTGVFLGLFITDTVLSVIAGLGAIMLIGIVVKNAVVLVDYINLMRDRGYDLDEAIVISGKARLRPVLMTAFTTILGMLPLALGIGEGSEIWSPMGVAVIGGLIFSTVVTMIIVPVMYRELVRRGERARKEKVWSHFRFMDI